MNAKAQKGVRQGQHTSEERPTVVPPFDPHAYARSQEGPRTDSPASDDELALSGNLAESDLAREMLELPESRFFARLDERVRRAELLLALLRSGGLSREIVGRALGAQLEAVRQGAMSLGAPQLVELLQVLGAVVSELCDVPRDDAPMTTTLDLLVLDENEISRDLVALAAESHGHTVRCAESFDEFVALFGERRPELVVSDAELTNAPLRYLTKNLRDVVGDLPLALFTTSDGPEVERVARDANVVWWVPKARGVEALTTTLAGWLEQVSRKGRIE